ncbi:MAG: hypothetical protein PHR44_04385 [Candidatus Omnitrophica bacterium]|nr:hypothetical protein [Candidatus Omnitrophota bacterium]
MKRTRKIGAEDEVSVKLGILIRLFIEFLITSENKNFNTGNVARILKSLDITPTEIARMLGKKSVTDVAPFLYRKK